ncbi:hypothetical protein L484_027608 [Morus notabilis]|uniref:Uncharacterized protein n=1 Tax=Morus notabilis TaxID=981085 RepID=W9S196_9ROSA|nr:hypothetical protein L484_027608 [Morus notabilis]
MRKNGIWIQNESLNIQQKEYTALYGRSLKEYIYKQPTKLEQHDAGIHKTVAPSAESLQSAY